MHVTWAVMRHVSFEQNILIIIHNLFVSMTQPGIYKSYKHHFAHGLVAAQSSATHMHEKRPALRWYTLAAQSLDGVVERIGDVV
jgi:hypothetical protein